MSEPLLDTAKDFRIGLGLDFAWWCAGALGALLVGTVCAFRFVEREDLLALVAGVVGGLVTEDIVGVAVGVLAELGSAWFVSRGRLG